MFFVLFPPPLLARGPPRWIQKEAAILWANDSKKDSGGSMCSFKPRLLSAWHCFFKRETVWRKSSAVQKQNKFQCLVRILWTKHLSCFMSSKKSDNLFSYFLTFDVLLKKSSIIKIRLKYRQKYSSVLRCKDQNWSVWTHNVLQPEGALVNTVSLAPTQYARHKTYETGFITNPHPDR